MAFGRLAIYLGAYTKLIVRKSAYTLPTIETRFIGLCDIFQLYAPTLALVLFSVGG